MEFKPEFPGFQLSSPRGQRNGQQTGGHKDHREALQFPQPVLSWPLGTRPGASRRLGELGPRALHRAAHPLCPRGLQAQGKVTELGV